MPYNIFSATETSLAWISIMEIEANGEEVQWSN